MKSEPESDFPVSESGAMRAVICAVRHLAPSELPIFLTGLGIPGATHTLQSAASINGAFVRLASVSADANASWYYEDAPPLGLASRFYRLSFP
jgi:hypothetical protein